MINNDLLSKNFFSMIQNKKICHAAIWVAILSFSFLLLVEYIKIHYYYAATDGLYYYSIAKNLHENGLFRDFVTGGRIYTPQNGAVFLQYILLKFDLVKDQIFVAVSLINYASLLSVLFPLLAIMKLLGIHNRIASYSIVTYCLCSWPFLSVLLFPQNEGLYFTGTIWLIYLLALIFQYKYDLLDCSKIRYRIYLFSCIAISILIVHFRLNLIFVPFAGIMAAILFKKFRVISFMILLLAVMMVSLVTPYHFIETDISKFSDGKIIYLLTDFKTTVIDFVFHAIPASIFYDFKDMHLNVLYIPVIAALFTTFVVSINKKKFLKLQILLICFMTYGLILVFGIFNVRYLVVIAPLIFMLMLDSKHFRSIAYLFIFACISTSLWAYYDGIKVSYHFDFWSQIPSKIEFEGDDPMLIASKPRSCWYFTGITPQYPREQWKYWNVYLPREDRHGTVNNEHVELFTWDDLLGKENIYVLGHVSFVDYQAELIKEMAANHKYYVKVKEISPLQKDHLIKQITLNKLLH